MQIEPVPIVKSTSLRLNVNSDIFAGRTLDEINEIIKNSKLSLTENLKEAAIHETGHAKLIHGKSIAEIEKLYDELANKGINNVSPIALDDGAEAIAEIEVLLARGTDLSIDAKQLYEKYKRGTKWL